MLAAVLLAARTRLAAALPGAADRTGDPSPKPQAGAAFAAAVAVAETEPLGMGNAARMVSGTLSVTVWPVPTRPRMDAAALALAAAETVRAAIMAAPADLGGAAWSIEMQAADPELAAGNERITRVDVSFDVSAILPPA